VQNFLDEYCDPENETVVKCSLVIGLHGLMRISELINLEFKTLKSLLICILELLLESSKRISCYICKKIFGNFKSRR
jgi:hypothetical protein